MVQLANLRLSELVKIVQLNQEFYNDFKSYLKTSGYKGVKSFIQEKSDAKAIEVLKAYLDRTTTVKLYDGISNPYSNKKAKWYFLAWLMRDAPAQRLSPLLGEVPGKSIEDRKAYLLNEVRKFVGSLFLEDENWDWPAISEVILARLEGSRRSLKGNLFEGFIRSSLKELFERLKIILTVTPRQVTIEGETYDVEVAGRKQRILLPVKTRETMGGGHASLFTRDIGKAIDVARKHGYTCIPIVIAESWGGDLGSLGVKNYIYLKLNPNQIELVKASLAKELDKLSSVFRKFGD